MQQTLKQFSFFINLLGKKKETIIYSDIVGVYADHHGIAMAHVDANEPKSITVKSYQYIETSDPQTQKQALAKYVQINNLFNHPCSYVLTNNNYNMSVIETPQVESGEITKATRWLIKDFIDYPPEEAVVDSFALPLKRASDNKNISYAVIMRASLMQEIKTFVNESGLKLKYIDVGELCSRNLVMLHPENQRGSLFIKLNNSGGQVIISRKNEIFVSRRIDLKLNNLQESEEALDTLALDIQRSMDYCSSLFRQSLVSSIILAPAEIDLDKIQIILNDSLGMPIHRLDLIGLMKFNKEISIKEQSQCLFAIGAGLRNLMVTKDDSADKFISS